MATALEILPLDRVKLELSWRRRYSNSHQGRRCFIDRARSRGHILLRARHRARLGRHVCRRSAEATNSGGGRFDANFLRRHPGHSRHQCSLAVARAVASRVFGGGVVPQATTKWRKPAPVWHKVRRCVYDCGRQASAGANACYDCARRERSQAAKHVEGARKLYG